MDVSPLASLTSLDTLLLRHNPIGGQGAGNVDALASLTAASSIVLGGNPTLSCAELGVLIDALGSPPVDTDWDYRHSDVVEPGVNCTEP